MDNNWGKRATDNGKEDPFITLARIDERLIALDKSVKQYVNANQGDHQALNSKINDFSVKIENKVNEEIHYINKKIDFVNTWVVSGIAGVSVLVVLIGWGIAIKAH